MNPPSNSPSNTNSTSLIIGSGGIATALFKQLSSNDSVGVEPNLCLQLGRRTQPAIDYASEPSLAAAAQWVSEQCAQAPLRRMIVATGYLHTAGTGPERAWSQLDAAYLQRVFLVNAIGPALVMKHFFPLLATQSRVEVAFLSAKVGSISDNALGGWYGYRAAKAALNQLVKTASIELTRKNKQSICVALHPGTVDTALSAPFAKAGLNVRPPEEAAADLLRVLSSLDASGTGLLWDYRGELIQW